ncbi:MAG: hypothetical protein M1818_008490 [Claussenomyces sp. TS43310]|nr:MAG: hypothetical protein M1818_008490 [Claussenomyces sp. TS43310]
MVYLYLSMSFIQMLKALGPVATVLACWSIGLRNPQPSIHIFLTVCVIVAGVMISSIGELRFVLLGVFIQGAGIASEAYKNALQQFLLTGKTKMSSLTLLYYFAPACTVLNMVCVLIFETRALRNRNAWTVGPWIFLFNGFLTFGLNIASVATVGAKVDPIVNKADTQQIKKTSSLVLTLCGIPKAILMVGLDMALYGTPLTLLQAVGFAIAGLGTYHYSRLTGSKSAGLGSGEQDEKSNIREQVEDEESRLMGHGLDDQRG